MGMHDDDESGVQFLSHEQLDDWGKKNKPGNFYDDPAQQRRREFAESGQDDEIDNDDEYDDYNELFGDDRGLDDDEDDDHSDDIDDDTDLDDWDVEEDAADDDDKNLNFDLDEEVFED